VSGRPHAPQDSAAADRFSPLELEAWRGMLRTHAILIEQLDRELQAQAGLPLTSYDVLVHLSEAPGSQMRMSDLAATILLSKSGLTRVVDSLEKQGFVERVRAPDDARGLYAALTKRGKAKLRSAHRAHVKGVRTHFLNRLTSDQQVGLANAWDAVLPGEDG
jgi:DNA-binding MarR family transcriptional regulator